METDGEILGDKMKEINLIKLTKIATILQTIPSNNSMNGEPGFSIVNGKKLNGIGNQLMEIINDEVEN